MHPYAIFVHGFNVKDDGKNTVDTLKPVVQRFHNLRSVDYDYGWLGLFGVRFLRWRLGKTLSGIIQEQDILIGHSNGCAFIYDAIVKHKKPNAMVFFIAPALDADVEFPRELFNRVVILHSKHDLPVKLSRYIPLHPWGNMGAYGAKASNVVNIDCSSWAKGHSDYFASDKVSRTRAILAQEIRNAYVAAGNGVSSSDDITKLRDCNG